MLAGLFLASFPPKQLINAHEVNVKSWTTNPKQQNWKLNQLDPAFHHCDDGKRSFNRYPNEAGLAFRYHVASRQLHVLDVPPRDGLNRRVMPERLSDAHGGEGKARQIVPAHQSTHK